MFNTHSKRTSQLGKAGKTPWPTVRATEDIPSITRNKHTSTRKTIAEEQDILEVSRNFTVAPAYNKGAYQVISKDDVEYIGR